ncbi:MAG: helix-turn-helix domain-containing protein [Mastigocoleus sp. MO_188.B34]|nr:helix-turn-helix domain-containing protein [Mastigocoleus sp. MO_188.B34]MDJ0697221.1 helix-turn-helix domain-containing protein [Mastigocoleus sp. MO_188.B34]
MTMTSVYTLTLSGNSTIEISQDELRSILGDIETELHRSKVYRCALTNTQKLLGSSAEQAKVLFKAVGREAIGLAFRQFIQQHQKVIAVKQETSNEISNSEIPSNEMSSHEISDNKISSNEISSNQISSNQISSIEPATNSQNADTTSEPVASESQTPTDLSNYLTSARPQPTLTAKSKNADKVKKSRYANAAKNSSNPLMNLLNSNKKASLAQLEQQMLQHRKKILLEIGQQLKEARELRHLSLEQLNTYTHVPVHKMEAVENGQWELLPEDVFVRGFIRVMGNALGMNGTALAASIPLADPKTQSVLPSWYEDPNSSTDWTLQIRPIHLYVGYTAFVAGAIGGLHFVSQQAEANKLLINSNPNTSSISQKQQDKEPITKPGLQSNVSGIVVGSDIAPPEAM